MVRDIRAGEVGSNVSYVTAVGSLVYFAADDGDGYELWKSDGTTAGTMRVADLSASPDGSRPDQLTNVGGTLFFTADDGVHGRELYRTDGNAAGTTLIRDFFVEGGARPQQLRPYQGTLYYTADDGIHGRELWQTDGTFTGTMAVADINPGYAGSTISGMVRAGNFLFLSADDGVHGRELWVVTTTNNHAPTLDATKTPALTTIVEDAAAPVSAVGTLVSQLVDYATSVGGADNAADVDAAALLGIAVTVTSGSGTWYYSINNGATWLAVGSVTADAALMLAADSLTRLYFKPNANFSGSIAAAITFRAWDRTAGVSGTRMSTTAAGGTAAFSAVSDTASLDVTAVNDAPTLQAGAMNVGSIYEDQTNNAGYLVSDVLFGRYSDADIGALSGIAVAGLTSGNGKWQFSTSNGNSWTDVGAVSVASALLLRSGDRIRFLPDAKNGTTASFTFCAWDQTSGVVGTKVNTTPNGGATAFSSIAVQANLIVTDFNDAPVLTGANAFTTITEDDVANTGNTVASLVAGIMSDVDTGAVQGIAVTQQFAGLGRFEYSLNNGSTWTAMPVLQVEAALLLRAVDRVRFVPDGANGTYGSITFRGWDQTSGVAGTTTNTTLSGGLRAYSSATAVSQITVTAVNDAPVLDPAKSPTMQNAAAGSGNPVGAVGTLVSQLFDSSGAFNNTTDRDSGALRGVAVTAIDTSKGSWFYSLNSGATWLTLTSVSATTARLLAADAGTRLYFKPIAGFAGMLTTALTFRAWDQTSGTNGATADTSLNGGTTAFSTDTEKAKITVA
jgi:ELWxxDGT repeat protein